MSRRTPGGPSIGLAVLLTAACGTAPAGGSPPPDPPGRLVVVGGGLDDDTDAVWRAATEARDGSGPFCVLPTASGVPERSMASAMERLEQDLGAGNVEGILVTAADTALADTPELAERLRSCSGFWFTGGDQSRIVDVFLPGGRPSAGYRALRERHAEGAVVAGSSAGAAIMTARMIAGGGSESALEHGVRDSAGGDGVWVRGGMGFLQDGLVDQHFLRRGRFARLVVAALAGEGGGFGFGIDENTALVIDGDEARVVGESGVVLIDARAAATRGTAGVDDPARGVVWLLGPGDAVRLPTLDVRPASRAPVDRAGRGAAVSPPEDPFDDYALLHLLAGLAASPDTSAEVTAAGHRLRFLEGPGFEARADGPGGVDGAPRGFSAGPWTLELGPADGA